GTVRHDLKSENSEFDDEKPRESVHQPSDDSENSEKPNGTDGEIKTIDAVAALAVDAKAHQVIRGTQGTGNNEWHTPQQIVDLSRTVLGTVDLDPATTVEANEIVKATRIYTKADDGLKQENEWHGNVFLNPPYAQPDITLFVSKMVAEYKSGRVKKAI